MERGSRPMCMGLYCVLPRRASDAAWFGAVECVLSTVIAPSAPTDTTRLRRVLWLVAALTAVFLLVWRWPFHTTFEIIAIVVLLFALRSDSERRMSIWTFSNR